MKLSGLTGMPTPDKLLDRARRLYVLSSVLCEDPNWSFCRLTVDHRTHSICYQIDLRSGEDARICSSPSGTVVFGTGGDIGDDEERDAVRVAIGSRDVLMAAVRPHLQSWEQATFCAFRTSRSEGWSVPTFLRSKIYANRTLGLCGWLVDSPGAVSKEIAKVHEKRSAAILPYLTERWPALGKRVERIDEATGARAWAAALTVAWSELGS